MKTVAALFVSLFFFSSPILSQEMAETTFRVSGLCNMCKSRIEKAVKIEGVEKAVWDRKTKMLAVAYDSAAVSIDSLQKRIAAAGHDTGSYTAPDSVYAELPECCHYRGSESHH